MLHLCNMQLLLSIERVLELLDRATLHLVNMKMYLICRGTDVLDHQVDHAPQVGILVLEKLCHAEEDLRCFFLHQCI